MRQAVEGLDATRTTLALPSLVGRAPSSCSCRCSRSPSPSCSSRALGRPPRAPQAATPPAAAGRDLIVVTGNAVGSLIAAALEEARPPTSKCSGRRRRVARGGQPLLNARLAKARPTRRRAPLAEAGAEAGNASRAAAVWAAPRVREVVARAAATTRRVPRATDAHGRALAVTAVHTGRATARAARLATAVSTAAAKAAARALADGAKEAGHATAVVRWRELRPVARRGASRTGARRRARPWRRTWARRGVAAATSGRDGPLCGGDGSRDGPRVGGRGDGGARLGARPRRLQGCGGVVTAAASARAPMEGRRRRRPRHRRGAHHVARRAARAGPGLPVQVKWETALEGGVGRGERAEDGDIARQLAEKRVRAITHTQTRRWRGRLCCGAAADEWGKSARISSSPLRGLGGSELGSFSFGDGRHG